MKATQRRQLDLTRALIYFIYVCLIQFSMVKSNIFNIHCNISHFVAMRSKNEKVPNKNVLKIKSFPRPRIETWRKLTGEYG